MFDRAIAALKATNLLQVYMDKFKDEKMTDEAVLTCLKNPQGLILLKDVIPAAGDRMKFITEFQNAQIGTPPQEQHEQRTRRKTSGSPEKKIVDEEEDNSKTFSSATTQVKIEPTSPTSSCSSFSTQNSTSTKTTTDVTSLIKDAYVKSVQLYTTKMNDLLSTPGFFLDESALCKKHEENRSKAIKQFLSSYEQYKNSTSQVEIKSEDGETQTISVKIDSEIDEPFHVRMSDCYDEIDKKFEKYKEQNQRNHSYFVLKANNFVREAEKLYIAKMEKFIDNRTDEEENEDELKKKEKEVNKQVMKYLNDNIQNPFVKSKLTDELTTELQKSMKKWFDNHLKLSQLQRNENAMAVNRAFDIAKNYYNEQMEKRFNSQKFIEPLKLVEMDQKICTATLKKVHEKNSNLKLSLIQEKKLKDAMKILYKKYEDKNLLRKPSTSSCAIGIDLGTTNSCVAVYRNGKVEVIYNENGNKTTPSFVCFQDDESALIGDVAKDQSYRNPENTIFDSKRLIGRNFGDEKVQENIKTWSFDVINDNEKPKVLVVKKLESPVPSTNKRRKTSNSNKIEVVPFKTYHAEEISALILRKMKKIAEDFLGVEVKDAVITVPALFNDYQRQATRDAGEIAGLNVLRIINEPTAAAIAYNLHRKDDLKRNVLVFDLGGGTLDVVVLEIVQGEINVKSVHGDTHLGGQDFDTEMIKYCIDSFKKQHGIDLARHQDSRNASKRFDSSSRLRRIRNECEKQKKVLSSTTRTTIGINAIESEPKYVLDLHVPFTRELFESLNQKHFERCLEIVQLALDEAKLSKTEIDDIVLVGGSTRIPKIQKMLSDFFDGKALCKSINPDEAVAEGAAIHACILSGQGIDGLDGMKLNDVIPSSIGIAARRNEQRDCFSTIIPKNTVVPCERTHFYSSKLGCSQVSIEVYEGEDQVATKNNLLGKFVLDNVPIQTKTEERNINDVKVTMKINTEGILHVRAECLINGESNELLIKILNHRMTRLEIEDAKVSLNLLMK